MGSDDHDIDARDQASEPSDNTLPAARRLPRAVYWRRRAMVAAVPVALGALVWGLSDAGSSSNGLRSNSASSPGSGTSVAGPSSIVAVDTNAAEATTSTTSTSTSTQIAATTVAWRLPAAVSGATVVVANGDAMVLGGRAADGNPSAAVVSVDLLTGEARSLVGLPQAVEDGAGALLGTRVVVMGGRSSAAVQAVEGRTAENLANLPAVRAGASAITYGRDVVLLGGSDGTLASRDVLRTSDGKTFTTIGQLAVPVAYAAATLANGKVIVVGGETNGGIDLADIQVFDLDNNTASIVGRMPQSRSHAGSATLDGSLHLFGGRSGAIVLDTVDRVDLHSLVVANVGRLPAPTSDAGVAVLGDVAYLLGGSNGVPIDTVTRVDLTSRSITSAPSSAPSSARSSAPFDGLMLIADTGNGRLLAVNADHEVVWQYPTSSDGGPSQPTRRFADAIFTRHGTAIMATSRASDTIVEIDFPSGSERWTYGSADRAGSGLGFLNAPSDALRLDDGSVIVADAGNCRLVEISATKIPTAQMGSVGECHDHQPPNRLAGPTSVTPLDNGNILVAEVNGSYVNELTLDGARVWTTRLAITRPSEPRQVGEDRYLVSDASRPGGVYEFSRDGAIVSSYAPPEGEAMLDHPTQAARLPSGLIAVSDTNRHRVVIVDPATSSVVWQYGQSDVAGSGSNQLALPGGFDMLAADGSTPLHAGTG